MPEVWFPNLGIEIERLPRVAFEIFSLPVYWYGICIFLGIWAGLMTASYIAKKTGQNPELYQDFLMYAVVVSLIGARIYYVAFQWSQYKDNLISVFYFREGGIAIYGGVIGAFITAVFFTKKKKLNLLQFLDTCAPGLVIGQAIGRWGNFFNREVFGRYTESTFAMRYLYDQVDVVPASVKEHLVTIKDAVYIQVEPTFLYESMWNLALFILMMVYYKKKRFEGEITAIYFFVYGIGRFWIEGIRTDQLYLWNTSLPVSQALSLVFIIGAVVFYVYRYRTYKSQRVL